LGVNDGADTALTVEETCIEKERYGDRVDNAGR